MPPEGAGEYVEILVHQPHRRHLTDAAPQRASSPGRRPTSTSYAGPATAPETATSPAATPKSAMPTAATPSLGRGDRFLLDQSVTRSWSSRLRRRQEDRRHQTPRRRGHPGPAGGRAGRRDEDPAVQDADRRRDQARAARSSPSMGRRADFAWLYRCRRPPCQYELTTVGAHAPPPRPNTECHHDGFVRQT